MLRLNGPLRRLRHDDRGAVSVLVAAVLGVGLLLGMGALVVDTGQLYGERAQLQNGADAAALALAQDCAGAGGCAANPYSTATRYAGSNANDGVATVSLVCGRDSAARLAVCPQADPAPQPCLGTRPATGNFVEVRVSTRQQDGSTVVPSVFGQVLLGGSYSGRGVLACARVAWGGPRIATGFALTISLCEWQAATVSGSQFAAAPPAVPAPTYERVLLLHGSGIACAGGPSGWDLPGGFGWLDDQSGNCTTRIDIAGTYHDNTGVSASQACKSALDSARTGHKVVLVPVYDGAGGSGHGGTYHLRGFASFVLTGYSLSGFSAVSWLTGVKPCTGTLKCISGYFTRELISTNTIIGGPQLGATTVQVVG